MSRYVKSFEVSELELLKYSIEDFLKEKRFILGKRNNEDTWMREGFACKHCIIIKYEANIIELIAFIVYNNYEHKGLGYYGWAKEESESSIKGFLGGFGKWPIQKTVRQLKKMIKNSQIQK